MKILIVEDNFFKRNQIEGFLEEHGIYFFETFKFLNTALKFILENKEQISGIILDLGLRSFKDSNDYDSYKGFYLISELNDRKITIPILVNSTTKLESRNLSEFPYVFGQRERMNDYKILEEFITFLKEREEQ